MASQLSVVPASQAEPVSDSGTATRPRVAVSRVAAWLIAAGIVLGAAIAFIARTRARPGFDAYGWLVWGHQTLHWNLNTDGAPSWKPLTFLFTLPYALIRSASVSLWVVTAVAGAFAGVVFAARIAYKVTGPCPGRRYAPIVAALIGGAGQLGIDGYTHQLLIANADPFTAALCLAAIDSHLNRRPRLAFLLLLLVSFGRPEAWLFSGLYALWMWRAVPSSRLLAIVGLLLIPVIWFSVPALTSRSWLTPSHLDLNSVNAVHGNKFTGVINRFVHLHAWSVQVAALIAVVWAIPRRDRATLALAAAAVLWVAVEIALALGGYSAVPRYLFEPAAVVVVLAGTAAGRVLAWAPQRVPAARWLAPVVVVAFLASLYPYVHNEVKVGQGQVTAQRSFAKQLDGLSNVIAKIGGPARILACGQPATLLEFQSTVAWDVGLNVGSVAFRPGRSIGKGVPIVLLKPHLGGWQVRTYNIPRAKAAGCVALRTNAF